MHNILITGGSGLLGTELQKYLPCDAPSHEEMDILNLKIPDKRYTMVIHCAGYTDVDFAEKESEKVFDVNLGGTINLLYEYGLTPFVYISSEYAHNPVNMYAASKYAGEVAVKALAEQYLIIRTLFKANPWTLDTAWENQHTQGDYVNVIAPLIFHELQRWKSEKYDSKMISVGTGRKTMFELAQRTKPDVKPVKLEDWRGVRRPYDYL